MMTIATNHELQVKISESMELDLLKFMSIKIWGSTEGSTEICELRSTEISSVLRFVGLLKYEGLNLEGLLKFGVLKSRGSTEIQKWNKRSQWSIEISRIYWNPKRVFSIYIHSIILGALRVSEIAFHAFSQKKHIFFRGASRQRSTLLTPYVDFQ